MNKELLQALENKCYIINVSPLQGDFRIIHLGLRSNRPIHSFISSYISSHERCRSIAHLRRIPYAHPILKYTCFGTETQAKKTPPQILDTMSKIGVFPASGGLGTSIVNHLRTLVPESDLILIARNPAKLSDEKEAGATIRQADYDDPASLDNAFDGIHTLMLISYASFEIDHRVKVST